MKSSVTAEKEQGHRQAKIRFRATKKALGVCLFCEVTIAAPGTIFRDQHNNPHPAEQSPDAGTVVVERRSGDQWHPAGLLCGSCGRRVASAAFDIDEFCAAPGCEADHEDFVTGDTVIQGDGATGLVCKRHAQHAPGHGGLGEG